jgi:hypothetical protein
MQIPKGGCHWINRDADELGDCHFEMFLTKIQDIQEECGGSDRKQTKQETMIEGFNAVHNDVAAKGLVGSRFLISRSGAPLHLTTLPTDVLRKFPLPQELEDELTGNQQKAPPTQASSSGSFASFGQSNTFSGKKNALNDEEARRISFGAKCMFLQLAASMEVIYADETGDLLIVEIKDKKNPVTLVEGVFDSGEHPEGYNRYSISFGLIKKVEA